MPKMLLSTEIVCSICRYFAGLLVGCLQGVGKHQLLSPLFSPVTGYWEKNPLVSHTVTI